MILTYAACNYRKGWRMKSADIKAALLKGELFQGGERVKAGPGETVLPMPLAASDGSEKASLV